MSFLARSSLLVSRSPLSQRALLGRAAAVHLRGAASSVSARPGSQTLPHAAQNVKEEVGNTASDLARSLGGGALNAGKFADGGDGFLGVTSKVAASVPKPVMAFGLAGALPYLGTSLSSLWFASQAGKAASGAQFHADPDMMMAMLNQCLHVQATYGAALLSFLGAIHWGFEFAGFGGHHGAKRLMLGAAPVLFAWPTLLLEPTTAIIAQWVGFTALWGADQRITLRGWAPNWYSQYRFYLSILIGTCMIGTLAGTSYLGPSAGHGFTTRDLQRMRDERHRLHRENEGTVKGPYQALPATEDSDSFVILSKQEPPAEAKDGKSKDAKSQDKSQGGKSHDGMQQDGKKQDTGKPQK
ncbi:hypothetical protein BKA62DRAFT_610808 [Auriculariales sp. MPI-PUGE-AT-0066]|nr:hypothetical protein BKA62DRAFT_610808 [Auriculariales sp. MPI-PUGE-AT-0066]